MKEFCKAVRIYLDKDHHTRYNKVEAELSYQDCVNIFLYSSEAIQEKICQRIGAYTSNGLETKMDHEDALKILRDNEFDRLRVSKLLKRNGFNVPHLLKCADKFIEGRTA